MIRSENLSRLLHKNDQIGKSLFHDYDISLHLMNSNLIHDNIIIQYLTDPDNTSTLRNIQEQLFMYMNLNPITGLLVL